MSASSNLPNRRRAKQSAKSSNFSLYLIGAVMLLLIVGVVAINIWNSRPVVTVQPIDLETSWINRNSLGNPDAKVVIDAYEDFLCPHCAEFNRTVKPLLYEEYIKTGKARFVYHTFPLGNFQPGASIAANAALCAADQNQFWQMHDQLFAVQSQGMSAYNPEPLSDIATALGMDGSEFSNCLNSLKYSSEILDTATKGAAIGVEGTPAIFVNNTLVANGAEYAALKGEIDKLLASAG